MNAASGLPTREGMFFKHYFVVLENFLEPNAFATLRKAIVRDSSGERVHIPAHKRGETISYEDIQRSHPQVVRFYESDWLAERISRIVGVAVRTTPKRDQSSCSILIYNRPGDRIGWHFDHNFYRGRHFTGLLSLVNENAGNANLSSSSLVVERRGRPVKIDTPPNTFVLFEGARVRHCVTPQSAGEVRVVLSMTFCTDAGTTFAKDVQRRFKDIAYFGLRALWI